MQTWKVGDITITRIVEYEGPMPGGGEGSMVEAAYPDAVKQIDWLRPHWATDDGMIIAAIHALLIETPSTRIVVDTCVGNGKIRPGTFFDNLQTPFLDHMKEAGWHPDSVDIVLCTHLHVDHVGWNTMKVGDEWVPTFPNARYLMGEREYEHWEAEGDAAQAQIMADSVAPIFDAGLAVLVPMDYQVTDGVRLVPTPGHTPGHVSVEITSKGETAVITGDLTHHPCQLAHPEWSSGFDTDQKQADATRAAFFRQHAGSPTLIMGTHWATPTAGHIIHDGNAYRLKV
ncbi:MBL fold metallo-hydrolase [Pyruvatibacter mobilis]|jgi:glyoxylase-like metal-dependent hydrolase (beta-lactamase superfamily II)|uniref:MBL fold metallo-hydrolase n=1 Tax=Pyruvatibacter mobilis TaxID=1712261 RepID=UPI003D09A5B0